MKQTYKLSDMSVEDFRKAFLQPKIPVVAIARALGVSKRAVYYKAQSLGIEKPDRQSRERSKCTDELFAEMWHAGVRADDIMRAAGYANVKVVSDRRKRLGLPKRNRSCKLMTSGEFYERQMAKMMGVSDEI